MTLSPENSASKIVASPEIESSLLASADVVVHVWHAVASENDPGVVERHCESWLDETDRERSLRLKRATTRNQHVIGRGMMRRLLSDGCDGVVDPQAIRFATFPHGKPYVLSPREVCRPFNVSHTGGLVIGSLAMANSRLAVDSATGDTLLGVDVERLDRRTDASLADRYFSKPEVEYVRSQRSDEARQAAFLRVWTLKESFIKAIGTGLSTPLADFTFRDIDAESPWIEMLDPNLERNVAWKFFTLQPRPGFIAAVAIGCRTNDTKTRLDVRCFEDLLT